MDLDETLEGRRGEQLSAKGIYRDPVRSSRTRFVKGSGLRWVCQMLLARIPWVDRMWPLPFLRPSSPLEQVLPGPRPSATIIARSGPAGCATGTPMGPDQRC
jgi:hypothetical protein